MYFTRRGCSRQRIEQSLRDAIGIGVEKTHPGEGFDARQAFEQRGQAVAQAEVFAVGGGVLADERDFAHAGGGQIFRFAHHRLESAAAEFSAQLRDDAERAGMVAALGDLDVGGVARRREHAGHALVIEKHGSGRVRQRTVDGRARIWPSTA